jgi:hypothetical protein
VKVVQVLAPLVVQVSTRQLLAVVSQFKRACVKPLAARIFVRFNCAAMLLESAAARKARIELITDGSARLTSSRMITTTIASSTRLKPFSNLRCSGFTTDQFKEKLLMESFL